MIGGAFPPLRGEWVRGRGTIALVLTCVCAPAVVGAQSACAVRSVVSANAPQGLSSARAWTAPLDRPVTLHLQDVTLREALDRVAAGAHVRLSYSGDLLPLDHAICASWNGVPAGDALVDLIGAASVEPVAAGSDQVVLAPVLPSATMDVHPLTFREVGVLQRVVITGSNVGIPQRASTLAIDVLHGPALARQGATSVSQMVDGAVPGIWLWNQSPSTLLARYGSIRGASSFGLSYPKMYIDGIEVANPLLLTHFTPELVDRIEVIRGPQGAALFGADAISGVVNIYTRHDGVDADGERVQLQTGAGLAESRFAPRPVLTQEHSLSLRTGDLTRSTSLAISASSLGDFVPNAFSRELRGSGALRLIGARSSLAGTARFYAKEAGLATNPLLTALRPPTRSYGSSPYRSAVASSDTVGVIAAADSAPQSMRQYTIGATATFAQSERWTHTVVAGIDGYRLTNVPDDVTPVPSPMDSALRAARGGGDRTTLRASSVTQLGGNGGGALAGTLTFSAEHSLLRQQTLPVPRSRGTLQSTGTLSTWSSTAGLVAQANASLRDAVFLTSGLRLERDDVADGAPAQTALLPTVGAAIVRDVGPVVAKLRGAYGRGMRPARSAMHQTAIVGGMRYLAGASALAAEQQSGTELGADLLFARRLAVHVTRFDQRAYGLIQPVLITANAAMTVSSSIPGSALYTLQNVGEIANRGWELQSAVEHGRLALQGALSLVDSRVVRIAEGYAGDLRAGDRMLAVPARTASFSATWSAMHWFTSVTAMRASDWVNYDRLGLVELMSDSTRAVPAPSGVRLRDYWRAYSGVTRLRGTFSRDMRHGLAFVLTADNLLNAQRGEPDDITVLPGRTITAGLRARF